MLYSVLWSGQFAELFFLVLKLFKFRFLEKMFEKYEKKELERFGW